MTADELLTWRRDEILKRLDSEQVPAAPVLRREEVLDHAQIVENETIEIREHPKLGPIRQARPAARFEGTPAEHRHHAPFLGEHSREVLREVGLPDAEIDALEQKGVIQASE